MEWVTRLESTPEWEKILSLAEEEARSFPAKEKLKELRSTQAWAPNLSEARLWQAETAEAAALLERDALWGPLLELVDITPTLDRLARGSTLELEELQWVRKWFFAIDSWVQVPREDLRAERFKKSLLHLMDPKFALQRLGKILTPEGELSEKATPRLGTLFSEIRSLKREISAVLDQLLQTFAQKGVLQENFTDVRDGRYVLPIKISSQNEVDGIIYEASVSRQTVFVEPKEVAALNNRLRQRQNDLIQEISIILQEISKELSPIVPELASSIDLLVHWDSVQAKARLGRRYAGKTILVTENRQFRLQKTAHPLLWWSLKPEEIIRNDIEFGSPAQTLLLTGPNTGGKTVLLKTLGFAGICARTGFPFPAIENPEVPFFDAFYSDLGDPQSIENHLSSFSGHVLKFKEILEKNTASSLILIDELNSATDPEEGAAFGRAILETMMQKQAMIVTTTHDPQLKALALQDPRILNASMEFDESSQKPIYRIQMGIPGRSRALETAERLGIPPEIIQLARKYLSKEHREFETILEKLQSDAQIASRSRHEALELRKQAEAFKEDWLKKIETGHTEVLSRTRAKMKRILEQAQDEVRLKLKRLDEVKTRRDVDQLRSSLNDTFSTSTALLDETLPEEAPEASELLQSRQRPSAAEANSLQVAPKEFQVGEVVRVPRWKTQGTVVAVEGDKLLVAMGNLKTHLNLSDIERLASQPKPQSSRGQTGGGESQSYAPPSRLDLRGERFEDAMGLLGRYLDSVFRNGNLAEVTIVHGLGTGALREGTLKFLKKLPYVKTYRSGGPGNGGEGATVVEFER